MLRALLPKMVNAPIHFGRCNYTTVQDSTRNPEAPAVKREAEEDWGR